MQCKFLLIISLLAVIAGCTKERIYENIYDGLQKREEIVHPSDEPTIDKQQSYEAYKRERAESLKKDGGETQ